MGLVAAPGGARVLSAHEAGGQPPGEPFAVAVETHTSVVILLGDRAYKVKKPVRLPFVDLSSRALRLANCRAEVELNRRLAPDVYLGVHVLGPLEEPAAGGAQRDVGEPVVVMRRMPADRRLSTLLDDRADRADRTDGLVERSVLDVARQVAALHAGRPPVHGYRLAATMTSLWREGRDQLRRFDTVVLPADQVDAACASALGYLAGRAGLLDARERAGLVREGHGDLLADDVFCLDDGARILDCLEFDARLRTGDVLADIAFLAMDLELHGAPDLARILTDRYAELDAERHPRSLEHHYVAYRAFVRVKVECLRFDQGDRAAAGRALALLALCRRHLDLAQPRLLLVGGLPGTGKTTLAGAVGAGAERAWAVISSDPVRKELAGLAPGDPAAAAYGAGIYDAAHTAATYAELLRRAGLALAAGLNVVLDASWAADRDRSAARDLAGRHGATCTEVCCVAPEAVCLERIARRGARSGSDADADVYRRQAQRRDPWPQASAVRTDGDPAAVPAQVLALLAASGPGEAPTNPGRPTPRELHRRGRTHENQRDSEEAGEP